MSYENSQLENDSLQAESDLDHPPFDLTCDVIANQFATVCAPVTVTPHVRTGTVVTRCFGNPVITSNETMCGGRKNGSCTFVISQTVRISVPVEFSATARATDTYVSCNGVRNDSIDE